MPAHAALVALTILCAATACAGGPKPQMGSVGISLDDGRIAAAVRTALVNERDLGLRDIAVDVRQGVVFLSGQVRTLEEAQHAATVVRGVQGVRDLTSSLSVKQ